MTGPASQRLERPQRQSAGGDAAAEAQRRRLIERRQRELAALRRRREAEAMERLQQDAGPATATADLPEEIVATEGLRIPVTGASPGAAPTSRPEPLPSPGSKSSAAATPGPSAYPRPAPEQARGGWSRRLGSFSRRLRSGTSRLGAASRRLGAASRRMAHAASVRAVRAARRVLRKPGDISGRKAAAVFAVIVVALGGAWLAWRMTRPAADSRKADPNALVVGPVLGSDAAEEDSAVPKADGALPIAAAGPSLGPEPETGPEPSAPRADHTVRGKVQVDARTGELVVRDVFGAPVRFGFDDVAASDAQVGETIVRLADGTRVAVPDARVEQLPQSWRYRIDYARASRNVEEPAR